MAMRVEERHIGIRHSTGVAAFAGDSFLKTGPSGIGRFSKVQLMPQEIIKWKVGGMMMWLSLGRCLKPYVHPRDGCCLTHLCNAGYQACLAPKARCCSVAEAPDKLPEIPVKPEERFAVGRNGFAERGQTHLDGKLRRGLLSQVRPSFPAFRQG